MAMPLSVKSALGVLVFACACGTPDVSPVSLSGVSASETEVLSTGVCPGQGAATWCLRFADDSLASLSVTSDSKQYYGFLTSSTITLPFVGTKGNRQYDFRFNIDWGGRLQFDSTFSEGKSNGTLSIGQYTEPVTVTLASTKITGKVNRPTGGWKLTGDKATFFASLSRHNSILLLWLDEKVGANTIKYLWPGEIHGFEFEFPGQIFMCLIAPCPQGPTLKGEFSGDFKSGHGIWYAEDATEPVSLQKL